MALERIVVAGGTGMIGRRIAHQLVQAGFQVTILTRNAQRPSPVPGAQLVEANLNSPDALRAALDGQHGLFIALSVEPSERRNEFHPEEDGLVNLLRAAQQTHIQRIGYLSSLLKDFRPLRNWWVMRIKHKAVARVRLTGIPYGIFNAACVMETLPERSIVAGHLLVPRKARATSWWIAADDLGRQVAAFFHLPKAPNAQLATQGPEPLTYTQAARTWRDASGRRVRILGVPVGLLRLLGAVSPSAAYAARLFRALRDCPETFAAQPTWDLLGRPQHTLRDFAQQAGKPAA